MKFNTGRENYNIITAGFPCFLSKTAQDEAELIPERATLAHKSRSVQGWPAVSREMYIVFNIGNMKRVQFNIPVVFDHQVTKK